MIRVIVNGQKFRKYNNIEEAREDMINLFELVTACEEKERLRYKNFIRDLKNCAIDDFNKLEYTLKFIDE